MRSAQRRLVPPSGALAALVLASASLPAAGLTLDLSPFAELGARTDSNLFRTASADAVNEQTAPDRVERSDTVTTLAAGLTLELDHGLQNVIATVSANRERYARFDVLDNTGRELLVGWQWAVGRVADGELGARETRSLDSFEDRDFASGRNLVTERDYRLSGNLNITPRWQAGAELRERRRRNTALRQINSNVNESSVDIGLLYLSPGRLSLGGGVVLTDGEYTDRQGESAFGLARSYDDQTVDARFNWFASGVTRVRSRLGLTRRTLAPIVGRDFSGVTGELNVFREISGKTRIDLRASRNVYSAEGVNANFVEIDAITLGADWAATVKTQFRAEARHERRSFAGEVPEQAGGQNTEPQQRDRLTTFGLDARWSPRERIGLIAEARAGSRSANLPDAEFDYYTLGLRLRIGY